MAVGRILASLLLLVAVPSLAAPQLDDVRQAAAYSQRVNSLAAQFGGLMNRTIEYDNLANGIVDGRVSGQEARRRVGELSPELWAAFKRVSDELSAVPEPPNFPGIENLQDRLRNGLNLAQIAQEMARSFIESGEQLVVAALSGDPSVLAELEARNLERMIAQVGQQISLYEVEIAYATKGTWNYHLDGAVKTGLEVMVLLLQATLQAAGDESLAGQVPDRELVRAGALIQQGLRQVSEARASAGRVRSRLATRTGGTAEERRLERLILEIFDDNLPQAFDVEERALTMLADLVANFGLQSDEELDVFLSKYAQLEEERARLVVERQRRIAEIP